MANRHRGEIEAEFNDTRYRLVLTLGALAELEAAFGDEDMVALASRFDNGRLSARDCIRVIGAGLRGAGYAIADDEVAALSCPNGAVGYVETVARLLKAAFGANATSGAGEDAGGGEGPAPFPGTR